MYNDDLTLAFLTLAFLQTVKTIPLTPLAMNRCRLFWITDPWETLVHPMDTTLRLMEEAVSLGVENCWADRASIRWAGDATLVDASRISSVRAGRSANAFAMLAREPLRPADFHRVVYRPDPPVDLAYLHALRMLGMDLDARCAMDGRCSTEIVNPPSVLAGQQRETCRGAHGPDAAHPRVGPVGGPAGLRPPGGGNHRQTVAPLPEPGRGAPAMAHRGRG